MSPTTSAACAQLLTAAVTYRDHFTGQEDQMPDFGIPYSDHGARHYSPALRSWTTPDPLSEKYYGLSPYNYCGCNPVNAVDLDGRDAKDRIKYALSYSGKEYEQEVGVLRYEASEEAKQKMDCSELVTRVMMDDNLLPANSSHDTSSLKEILSDTETYSKSSTPKEGDIALWDGHTGIVTAVNEQNDFKLMHARGIGKLSKENTNFTSVIKYCSKDFIGFYHPMVENQVRQSTSNASDINQYGLSNFKITLYVNGLSSKQHNYVSF